MHWLITSRWMRENQLFTWLSHDEYVDVQGIRTRLCSTRKVCGSTVLLLLTSSQIVNSSSGGLTSEHVLQVSSKVRSHQSRDCFRTATALWQIRRISGFGSLSMYMRRSRAVAVT